MEICSTPVARGTLSPQARAARRRPAADPTLAVEPSIPSVARRTRAGARATAEPSPAPDPRTRATPARVASLVRATEGAADRAASGTVGTRGSVAAAGPARAALSEALPGPAAQGDPGERPRQATEVRLVRAPVLAARCLARRTHPGSRFLPTRRARFPASRRSRRSASPAPFATGIDGRSAFAGRWTSTRACRWIPSAGLPRIRPNRPAVARSHLKACRRSTASARRTGAGCARRGETPLDPLARAGSTRPRPGRRAAMLPA